MNKILISIFVLMFFLPNLRADNNLLLNWHFDNWDGATLSTWTGSHAMSNWTQSSDTLVGNYSVRITESAERSLMQYTVQMDMNSETTYYAYAYVKGKGDIRLGIKRPSSGTPSYSAYTSIDTTGWQLISHSWNYTNLDTGSGGIIIRTNNIDGEIIFGAAWLSDIPPFFQWPYEENLLETAVIDWSFEKWEGNLVGDEPIDWTRIGATGSNHVRQTTTQVYSGSKAVDMRSFGTTYTRGIETKNTFPVSGGNYYNFGGWAYKDSGGDADSYQIQFQLEWRNAGNEIISTSSYEEIFTSLNVWVFYDTEILAPDGATAARYRVNGKRTGGSAQTTNSIFVDDAFVLKIESLVPDNHVTNFTASDTYSDRINFTWTDSVGANLPLAYLIKWSTVSFEDISNPIDGVAEEDSDTTINVLYGVEEILIHGFKPQTTYYFKIFPYVGGGADRKYKIDGAVPEVMAPTRQANLLLNWHFENWTEPGTVAGNLHNWSWTGDADKAVRSTSSYHDIYSAEINPRVWWNPPWYLTQTANINIPVASTYHAEIWILPINVTGANYVQIGLDIANPANGTYPGAVLTNITEEAGWIKITQTREINSGAQGNIRIASRINAWVAEDQTPKFIIGAAWLGDTAPPPGWPSELKISPDEVVADEVFEESFELTLLNYDFDPGLNVGHISLGGDLSGLTKDAINITANPSVAILQLSGNLEVITSRGRITVVGAGILNYDTPLSGNISVVYDDNWLGNWHFEKWTAGNPDNWTWTGAGANIYESEDGLVGDTAAGIDNASENFLQQFGFTMLRNAEYHAALWFQGTGSVRLGIKRGDGDNPDAFGATNYGLVTTLSDSPWTRIDYSWTHYAEHWQAGDNGGLRIGVNANSNEIELGAAWFGMVPPPPGWPFRILIFDALAVVRNDSSIASGADTIARVDVSVVMAASFRPVSGFEVTFIAPAGCILTDSIGAGVYGDTLSGITNVEGIASFYLMSDDTGLFEVGAIGPSEDFIDSAFVRFVEYVDFQAGWDTINIYSQANVDTKNFLLEPIWSPDGQNIAYLGRYNDTYWNLYNGSSTSKKRQKSLRSLLS